MFPRRGLEYRYTSQGEEKMNAGTQIRVYGTGRLAKRTTAAVILERDGRNVKIQFPSGNITTVDVSRIK